MLRSFIPIVGSLCLFCIPLSPFDNDETDLSILKDVNTGDISFDQAQQRCGGRLEVVYLSGKVFNFAPNIIPPETPVNDVAVYFAEYPLSSRRVYRSDENGCWTIPVIKFKHRVLNLSLIFKKEGFVTTKSNVLSLAEENIDSIAMQFPSTEYYDAAVAQIEQQVGDMIGSPYTITTLTVATVGKSWASMFINQFPHGDPEATVSIDPAVTFPSLGPIYFNESVIPDPTRQVTSDDGGVLFANLPVGTYKLTAEKSPFIYSPVIFIIEEGVGLYIASPPHSLQGTNDAGPGE